jgi:hypothetical protein
MLFTVSRLRIALWEKKKNIMNKYIIVYIYIYIYNRLLNFSPIHIYIHSNKISFRVFTLFLL